MEGCEAIRHSAALEEKADWMKKAKLHMNKLFDRRHPKGGT
jgi:hypothetical protein